MNIDFTPFFKKYEELLIVVDSVFDRIKEEYPDCVKCGVGCSDCCYALFDLTLIEALYINHHFNNIYKDGKREQLVESASRADRDIYKIKKKAYKDLESGKDENRILEEMAEERAKCPLLDDEEKCVLYKYRPITCRFYGIPTSIGGRGHTCGISGFVQGEQYPTVNLDTIHKKLYEISDELVRGIQSKYIKMADMLVPLSMAMITDYDAVYLGIADEKEEKRGE